MEPLKVHGDTIESLIRERRETEKEVKELQKEIDRLRQDQEKNSEQIKQLTLRKEQYSGKLTSICMAARTISAGD